MEVSSVQNLCEYLISSAIQRCRMSGDLCRLSVVLKSLCHPPIARISISDTGTGSRLEEFRELKLTKDCASSEIWDGVISLTTTSIYDNEIFQYHLNLREIASTRWLNRLPSYPKNGARFSGSEVSLSAFKTIDELSEKITPFFLKMQILKIPKVAMELVVERGEIPASLCQQIIQTDDCNLSPSTLSNIACLKSGFEDYVYKHGNSLDKKCLSCFPNWGHLKVGSGMACCAESQRITGLTIEAVIIISESEPSSPCFRTYGAKSEVLYFKDFSLCSIPQTALKALTSIDWKNYGIALMKIVEEDGHALIEWENLPAYAHVDIVLHCYQKQAISPPARQKTQLDRRLINNAIKLALDDLKEKYAGTLLSVRALKIRSYAPDLAKTIAGLILSSNDSSFQGECLSVLGLQSQDIGGGIIEGCIREKIVSVIETNDRKPLRNREAAPFLFEDDYMEETEYQEEEYDGEEAYSSLDL